MSFLLILIEVSALAWIAAAVLIVIVVFALVALDLIASIYHY